MNYKYICKAHELAMKMATDQHKGQPYKLSEFNKIFKPAAYVSIEDTAKTVRGVLQVRTAMSDEEIERCLNDMGLIKYPPDTKVISNEG